LRRNRFDRVRPDYGLIEEIRIAALHCLILDVNPNVSDSPRAKSGRISAHAIVPLVCTPPIEQRLVEAAKRRLPP
jgi:hypothetical protein